MTDKDTRPQLAVMNAVHDLPVLVARDLGFFEDEGLNIDFVTTPGMAQVTTSHSVKWDSIFDRPLDSLYNEGGMSRMLAIRLDSAFIPVFAHHFHDSLHTWYDTLIVNRNII